MPARWAAALTKMSRMPAARASSVTYQKVRRKRSERGAGRRRRTGSGPASEPVAAADDCVDVGWSIESIIDLAAQLHDVHTHGVGEGGGLPMPYVRRQT